MSTLTKRLLNEIKEMTENPPTNCSAGPENDDDLTNWVATILGPKDSYYEGGLFRLKIHFPEEYPFKPPECTFITKIFHPNISFENGHICLNVLGKNWTPALSVSRVLLSISALLDGPNPEDPLIGLSTIAANLLKEDKNEYKKQAQEYVNKYAKNFD